MRPRDRQRRRFPRGHAFRPGGEDLEPRIALSGAQIGVNLDFNDNGSENPMWTDVRNVAYEWWPTNEDYPGTETTPLTADGYPLASAQTMFDLTNYPDGTYGFSYTGNATIASVNGIGQLASVSTSNGVTTGTITVNHSWADGIYLHIHMAIPSTTDPMDNFHLMLPGYGNGTTPEPMFTPAFIQSLAPFSNIRFMNWEMTNDSTLANWSDRVQPNAFLTDGTGGVPYEDMIELANDAQKDMWINIPALATPQFVQSLAQLIDTELDSNLNVYVEYGNEDWNGYFSAYSQILSLAQANPLLNQSLDESALVAQQTAYTLVNDGQIFDQVFGAAQASRVRPVLGGQAAWNSFQTYELQFIQQQFGAPSQYIYSLAIAPYFAIDGSDNVPGLTLDQLFTDLDQGLNTYDSWITSNAALAQQYGVPLTAYEGGQGLVPNGNQAVMQQAQDDPRMYQLYLDMMQAWQQVGGGMFDAFQLTGPGNVYGFWGMLPDVNVTGSQKYDGMIASAYLPGDANTDGSVTYADFQTLQANYGSTNAWWVNGDFNDDGMVNWADLNLMRQNLTPAGFTLSQFAQQAVFGQGATVDSTTPLEFDGYGVTYASGLPLSSTSGAVLANETSTGQQIVLGGATYSEGLGFAGNSSTTIALNGQYSRFDGTIGVDSSSSAASSVVFQVYGDGQLLYQSPTLANGSAAVPIDLNVAGVKNLTLVVEAAPGSVAFGDHAVWADARLVSTANFGSTTPDTLTWQLSQNGQVVSTQTADSIVLTGLQGTYTLGLTVTDANGDQGTASTTFTVSSPGTTSVQFLREDSSTEGNWIGNYGVQGYDIAGTNPSFPSYAQVSFNGASTATWTAFTTDPRALENPGGSGASATTWYSGSSFTINVNLTDGQVHRLAFYALDWDQLGRAEQIQVLNVATGAVLDTETLSSFTGGEYVQWAVSGDVQIVVTNEAAAPANAVISGLFLDPTFAPTAPTMTWANSSIVHGTQLGSAQLDALASVPGTYSYSPPAGTLLGIGTHTLSVTFTPYDTEDYTTATATTTIAVTLGTTTINWPVPASIVYGTPLSSEQLDVTADVPGTFIYSPAAGSVLGVGSDTLTVFFTPNDTVNYTTAYATMVIKVLPASGGSATYLKQDTTTQGNWMGTYGGQGYDVIGGSSSLPTYATVTPSGQSQNIWASSTTDTRALQTSGGSNRVAADWYSTTSFTVNVDLTDGQTHHLELYLVNWDQQGRTEQVQISNASTGQVLSTQTVSSFQSGVYLDYAVSGNVLITITDEAGTNCVLSGLFLDPAPSGTATYLKEDTTTQGNWMGTYGGQGYDVIDGSSSLPSYVNVTPSGQSNYIWALSTTDTRTLQTSGGSSRIAATWWTTTSFTVNVNLTDGQTHDLELYLVNWDQQGRTEQVQISDASSGAVLSTQTASSFQSGVYLDYAVSGNVLITITDEAGSSNVLGGLFLDSAGNTTTPTVTWSNPSGIVYGTALSSTQLDATASVPGTFSYSPAAGAVPGAGTDTLSVTFTPADSTDYKSVTTKTTIVVSQATPTITWANPASIVQGTALSSTQLDATANVPGTFTYSPAAGTVLGVGNNQKLSVTFAPTDSTDYMGASATAYINVAAATGGTATFVRQDTTTQGTWMGTYGGQGYDVIDGSSSLPSYASVTPVGANTYAWAASTTDPRGLQTSGGSSRIAATWWTTTSFAVDVNLTDGQTHDLELYFLDWDQQGRTEQVQISDASTGAVLSTQTISSFQSGVYLNYAVSGDLVITITRQAGTSNVLSGLFLDPVGSTGSAGTATFLRQDTTTQGTWMGTYGGQGYDVIDGSSSLPSYASVTPVGANNYVWAASTTDPRGLQTSGGSSRIAATWWTTTSFAVDVNLTDGQTHDLELYFLDWDQQGRTEQVQISDASTGAVLSTQTISSFQSGVYLNYAVSGSLVITITRQAGTSNVLSGLFLDPVGSTGSAGTATFLRQDTTTQGTWMGTYGGQGYDVIDGPSSLPSYASITPVGANNYVWAPFTADPRALQTLGGFSRIAAAWYSTTSFTVDVNLTDGQTHDLELYFLDWDQQGRTEQVQISDAGTGAVLSTQTISSFQSGVYLDYAVSGNIVITITKLAGPNSVLSGLFLG